MPFRVAGCTRNLTRQNTRIPFIARWRRSWRSWRSWWQMNVSSATTKEDGKVIEILTNPNCEVVRPLCVDYNLIEVNDGWYWSIKERRFLDNAVKDKDIGHVTPNGHNEDDS